MGATPTMLLKTHVEKMSSSRDPTMLMKTSNIEFIGHDVYEKKGVSSSCRLKTGRGVYVQDRWCPHGRLIFLRRARREQLDVAPLQVGARNDSNVEAEGEKSRGGTSNPKRC